MIIECLQNEHQANYLTRLSKSLKLSKKSCKALTLVISGLLVLCALYLLNKYVFKINEQPPSIKLKLKKKDKKKTVKLNTQMKAEEIQEEEIQKYASDNFEGVFKI